MENNNIRDYAQNLAMLLQAIEKTQRQVLARLCVESVKSNKNSSKKAKLKQESVASLVKQLNHLGKVLPQLQEDVIKAQMLQVESEESDGVSKGVGN